MPAPDLAAVAEAARAAGAMAFARWRGEFRIWDKVPGHVVCEIDLSVNDLLRETLSALDPEAGWLSEETADSPERLAGHRVWVVDPIDGTRDFVRGRPGWAISVALVEGGRPTLAVLDAPARDEHWRAALGQGATLNGRSLRASSRIDFSGARVPADTLRRVDADLVAVEKPNSIALRIAMIADDRADLVASLRWGHEWDLAAAALIAQEAGAAITDALGRPLHFNSTSAEIFGVLASSAGIHAAAAERLRTRALAAVER